MIVGIDPGLKGAIGALRGDGKFFKVFDIPLMPHGKVKIRNCPDPVAIDHIFDGFLYNEYLIIEDLHGRPGEANMFNFGDNFGILRGIATLNSKEVYYVPPQTWKKHFKLNKEKDASLELARLIFPEAATYLKRKKDEGRAEALLIARYAFEKGIFK